MDRQERPWRVFYTRARAEKKVADRLARQDIEVFLPTTTVVRQWSDRKKKVEEPLFRNYLFARVDERERLAVLQVDSVVRAVAFGGVPVEVAAEEIEALQKALADPRAALIAAHPWPERGAEVAVVQGPLRGQRGEVLEYRGKTHLVLRVLAIQQAIRITVPGAWVQALDQPQTA